MSLILQKLNEEEIEEEDLVWLVVVSRSSGASLSSSAALETTSGRWGARRCTDYLFYTEAATKWEQLIKTHVPVGSFKTKTALSQVKKSTF